jgi:Flp pilus assembly protein TadG
MISFFRKLWQNKRGNALIVAAACLPMIVGAAGLASDTIQWTLWKRQLQRAADSAAISGVYTRQAASGVTTNVPTAVSHDLGLNDHTWMALKSGYPQVSYPADSGLMSNQVKVVLQVQQSLPFSSMFMSAAPTITASSTAASIKVGGDACIEALDPNAANAVYFSGNTGVYAPDCDIFSNSANTNAAAAKGSADVTANTVGGVGGVASSNNFHVTGYRPYSPALADPFANVNPDPSDMHCTSVNATANTNFAALKAAGYNCITSLTVGSNKSLDLSAVGWTGPLYINGGSVDFRGDFTCSGCTIVLTNNSASSPIGNITANAGTNVNITAPTSGTYKGIAIYQDRRAADCNNCNKINGNSASLITGAVYFPSQEVQYNGTGTTTAVCTMFVAKRINFTGNSGVTNKFKKLSDCSAEGLPSNSSYSMIRLVG